MERSMKLDKITLGTCYYPEHWPEEMWEEDLQRMLASGIEVIRIAEFAWSKIEPREGHFLYTQRDPAGLAYQQISGGAQCQHKRRSLPPWLQTTL